MGVKPHLPVPLRPVVATWDIRSENRPIENDCLRLLARKYDKSIQSERIAMLACNENLWS